MAKNKNKNPHTGGGSGANIYTGAAPAIGGGGGGGGGGKGKNKVPQGGLYGGKPGEAAANLDPEAFIRAVLTQSGLISGSGSPMDVYASDKMVSDMLNQYQSAVANDQRLSAVDWMNQTYGAGWQGKRGKNFQAGSLTADNPNVVAGYQTNYANSNPLSYFSTQALLPQGGNTEFSDWYNTVFSPRLASEYEAAQQANPNLNVADWYAQQNVAGRAQSEYQGWRSNQNPGAWAMQEAQRRGDTPNNGNAQFSDWYANNYAPQLANRFQAARATNPNLNFNDFEAGQNTSAEARRLYARRAPQYRQPSAYQPSGGRWAWWS